VNITIEDIKQDIENFEKRISVTRRKLSMLHPGYLPYQEHKKRECKRRALKADVDHLELLIGYALEGIELHQQAQGSTSWFTR